MAAPVGNWSLQPLISPPACSELATAGVLGAGKTLGLMPAVPWWVPFQSPDGAAGAALSCRALKGSMGQEVISCQTRGSDGVACPHGRALEKRLLAFHLLQPLV